MALPPEFSEQEHLQDAIRRWMNREIRDYFSDLGGEEWDEDITTPRASLRVACTHKDADSLLMTSLRWDLFERVRLQRLQIPITGIPAGDTHETRKFRPQIFLYFQEDLADVEPGYDPITGRITFRLMQYSYDQITPAIAQTLAQRVKVNFAVGAGYIWRKGKVMVSYTDKNKGYQLQLLCRSEAAGIQLINQVLDINNDAPDLSKCNVSENQLEAVAYPVIPPNDYIYGDTRRLPRRRPVGDVRFQYALLHVWGLTQPIALVDRTGLWPSALAA
ncbi:hypothetical protein IQ254_10635 [Nodosilinea sp. LEGE 07088]|uniref:hypothetical protein n=1 Tax=Nodosilinea sp. LEGE 07088 TaxID=2777968 RepID=UPI001880AB56|nr:hypothetical protein [Nodosilinea sp. LEGE 07088]MBE9137665.1 hypothetical protein [Nodosilinea sp. LEGE 07088]